MVKTMRIFLLTAIGLSTAVITSAYAMPTNTLQTNMTVEYELNPNEPQAFVNYLFWPIEANCKIASEDESNELLAEAKLKKGKVNGVELTAGNSLRICVRPGEVVKLNAESGAKVIITNFGEHALRATCSA